MNENITAIRALHTPRPVAGLERLVHSVLSADGTIVDHYELHVDMHRHARTTGARAAEAFAAIAEKIKDTPLAEMRMDPSNFPKLAFTDKLVPGDERYPDALTPILNTVYFSVDWELVKKTEDLDWVKDRLQHSFSIWGPGREAMQETRLLAHLLRRHPMNFEGFEESGIAAASPEQLDAWLDEITDYATRLQAKQTKDRPMVRRELLALGLDADTPARLQDAPEGKIELVAHDRATGTTLTYVMKND